MKNRLLIACVVASMPAEELHLADGSTLVGTILPTSGTEQVDLQMRVAGLDVTRHIERHRIVRIVQGTDDARLRLQRLETRAATLRADPASTAGRWWELACEAHAAGETALAESWAWREVLRRDPDHADARSSLGYVHADGQWKTPGQIAMEQGAVWHDGSWVRPEQRDAAISAERQAQLATSARFAAEWAEQRKRAAEQDRETVQSRTVASVAPTGSTITTYPVYNAYLYRPWTYRTYGYCRPWYGPVSYYHTPHSHAVVVWRYTCRQPISLLLPSWSTAPMGPPYRPGL